MSKREPFSASSSSAASTTSTTTDSPCNVKCLNGGKCNLEANPPRCQCPEGIKTLDCSCDDVSSIILQTFYHMKAKKELFQIKLSHRFNKKKTFRVFFVFLACCGDKTIYVTKDNYTLSKLFQSSSGFASGYCEWVFITNSTNSAGGYLNMTLVNVDFLPSSSCDNNYAIFYNSSDVTKDPNNIIAKYIIIRGEVSLHKTLIFFSSLSEFVATTKMISLFQLFHRQVFRSTGPLQNRIKTYI